MALHDLAVALQSTPVGLAISGSDLLFPTIETAHVFCLIVVVGSIAIVDLRLIGVASRKEPASAVIARYTPFTWWAFLGAFITGSLLFTSRAGAYVNLPVFWVKYGYMALAGLNMAYFHFVVQPSIAKWDMGLPSPTARISGALSLLFWASVVVCARRIGFHM